MEWIWNKCKYYYFILGAVHKLRHLGGRRDLPKSDISPSAFFVKWVRKGSKFKKKLVTFRKYEINLFFQIKNTSNLITAFEVDHLTSFGSGFLPEPNAIDFAFIFTRVSFSDHMTIFILLIIYFIVYFSGMIWATLKDKKDLEAVSSSTSIFRKSTHR